MIDAGPRNHLYLLVAQVKIRSCPRNHSKARQTPTTYDLLRQVTPLNVQVQIGFPWP